MTVKWIRVHPEYEMYTSAETVAIDYIPIMENTRITIEQDKEKERVTIRLFLTSEVEDQQYAVISVKIPPARFEVFEKQFMSHLTNDQSIFDFGEFLRKYNFK